MSFELFDTNGFNGGLQNVHKHTVLIIVHVHVSTLYVGLNSLFFKLISNTQFFKSDFYLKYIISYGNGELLPMTDLLKMTKKIMTRRDMTATPRTMPATMATWDFSRMSTNPGWPEGGAGTVVGGRAVKETRKWLNREIKTSHLHSFS